MWLRYKTCCLLFLCYGGDSFWTKTGAIEKHENSFIQLQIEANFKVLDAINILKIMNSGYKVGI